MTTKPKANTPEVPDALGDQGRAQLLAQSLANIQRQRFELEMTQVANGAKDSDQVPSDNGQATQTYAKARKALVDAEKRLMEVYPDLASDIKDQLAG